MDRVGAERRREVRAVVHCEPATRARAHERRDLLRELEVRAVGERGLAQEHARQTHVERRRERREEGPPAARRELAWRERDQARQHGAHGTGSPSSTT